jgi:hypothetical protein
MEPGDGIDAVGSPIEPKVQYLIWPARRFATDGHSTAYSFSLLTHRFLPPAIKSSPFRPIFHQAEHFVQIQNQKEPP